MPVPPDAPTTRMAPEGGTGRSDAETGRMSNVAGCHRILSWSCDDVAAVPRGACTYGWNGDCSIESKFGKWGGRAGCAFFAKKQIQIQIQIQIKTDTDHKHEDIHTPRHAQRAVVVRARSVRTYAAAEVWIREAVGVGTPRPLALQTRRSACGEYDDSDRRVFACGEPEG